MCGIVGYVGNQSSVPILYKGLKKLEYRGYDSAGIATIVNGEIEIDRSVGKLENLRRQLEESGKLVEQNNSNQTLSVGIGHTRWATHGKPSEVNAHPHTAGKICVVHNGIIENYLELRNKLKSKGCEFHSETDTEIAANLINLHYQKSNNLLNAVRSATTELDGSYALVVISTDEPDNIVVAKNATPVVIGKKQGECFIASDIPAILEYTRDIIILEDKEIAKIDAENIYIESEGVEIKRKPTVITWDPITAEKGGYRHFMLKEIHEQPQSIADTIRGRIVRDNASISMDGFSLEDSLANGVERICIVACGTAWHAALVTKFFIERIARIPVEVDYASEYRYREPLINDKMLFIVISQSGETADSLGALKLAKERGAKTLAICNVVGSSIARTTDTVFYTHAGPEISVASTKAFITQLTAGYLLALQLGRQRETLEKDKIRYYLEQLVQLPNQLSNVLNIDKQVEQIAQKYAKATDFLYLGRGMLYPLALEGALKLKEISYLHAEGYPAGEMKHGPIALIGEDTPVVGIVGSDGVNREKTISNLKEVESRGGKIIIVTDRLPKSLSGLADDIIEVGDIPTMMLPIALAVPLQLLAYYIAVTRGTDVDQPRNLAKSVTVE